MECQLKDKNDDKLEDYIVQCAALAFWAPTYIHKFSTIFFLLVLLTILVLTLSVCWVGHRSVARDSSH